jgi:hypothetical protein
MHRGIGLKGWCGINRKGLIFTISVFFVFASLLSLGYHAERQDQVVQSNRLESVAAQRLSYVQDDIFEGVLRAGNWSEVRYRVNSSSFNITFVGRVPVDVGVPTANESLLEFTDFYQNHVSPKNHVDLVWTNATYQFRIMPYNATIVLRPQYLDVYLGDTAKLQEIDITTYSYDEMTNAGWSDDGASYPWVHIHALSGAGDQQDSKRKNPNGATDYWTGSEGEFAIGNGVFSFEGDAATKPINITKLSLVYDVEDHIWIETVDEVTLSTSLYNLTGHLVLDTI